MAEEPEVPNQPDVAAAGEEEPPEYLGSEEVHTALIEGETFGPKAVQYSVVDGLAIFEGDILLGRHEDLQKRTEELRAQLATSAVGVGTEAEPGDGVDPSTSDFQKAVVITGSSFRWPGGVVPFEVTTNLPTAQANAVTASIQHWHDNTRLFFRARTPSDPQWVRFQPGSGCNSEVGRQTPSIFSPAPQVINLAAGCQFGQAVHEIGHAVGLWHEQSREDRDSFVQILWQNIQGGMSHNFDQHITDGDDIGPYDYGSIMHYGPQAFGNVIPPSTTPQTTIVALQPIPPGVTMGQRNGLSIGDRGAVAWMYGGIYPHAGNTWVGRFRAAGDELLYYSPARRHWYLTQLSGATMTFSDVSDTTGFGDLADGRPIWAGDFNGDGSADVLFYYPGDDNWWLGTLQGGQLQWSLVGNTAGFGHAIYDGRPFWTADFTGNGSTDVLFYYPGDDNWWLGQLAGGQLTWSFAGNTAGFGHAINDGRPFWVGDFDGSGAADVLFYYPGDDNWWLGSLKEISDEDPQCATLRAEITDLRANIADLKEQRNGLDPRDPIDRAEIRQINLQIAAKRQQVAQRRRQMESLACPATPSPGGHQLSWSLVGNTVGFGHGIYDGRPFWIGNFSGSGGLDVLFHYRGDLNWWRGSVAGNSLGWTLAATW